MSKLIIQWHGHSCFTVSANQYAIVLDPHEPDSVPGLAPLSLTANQVLCSHTHGDHGCVEAVRITAADGPNPFQISVINTWHDDAQGALRGPNRIHILEAEGLRVAHMGDIGCRLTDSQAELLKNLDAILIPVGGFYTIDASQAKELICRLSPKVVVPMHYRSDDFGLPAIGVLDDFTRLCDDVVLYNGDSIEIDKQIGRQTAVLKLNKSGEF